MRAAAAAIAAALALSACASQSGDPGAGDGTGSPAASGGAIRVAETNAFTSFNTSHANTNLDINSKIVGLTRSGFTYIDPELNLVHDDSFGTMEKISDSPLTVKYTIKDGVNWSDGNPVDKGDMLLQWAILSGHFDAPGEDAKPKFFQYAGSTDGLNLTAKPTFENDRTMTLVYSEPYVDWEIAFDMNLGTAAQPAHVVAKRAGLADEAALVSLLESATPAQANEQLAAVAKVWGEDFTTKTLPSDPEMYLSNGPMIVSQMEQDQSVTLKRNEAYTGNRAAKVDEITVRFIGDAAAQIAALRNGEVDVIAPQATTDTVEQVKGLQGVNVLEGSQLAYDHVDLSFDSDVFKDANVRKAFMMTIPRQQIVDRLIKPMYPQAEVVNSQLYLPSEGEAYTKAVEANGSAPYHDVNIEEAKKLLAGKTPTVRILYNNGNPIRVDAYSMIAQSASQAGFRVQDMGSADWSQKLGDGTYDASLFGWVNPGVGNAGIPQLYSSTGGGNYGKYRSAEVDALAKSLLTEIDPAKVDDIKRQIDKHLWDDGFGATLFQSPGIVGVSDQVGGLDVYMPNQTGVWWNFWEWTVKS
ncbi:putative ABC transporter substrate-binding protein [Kineosphaera limosa NBRC 100340]|uniref:Putative ABC transporter substrate-binding protein n=1 Tax=Kineosphaera limosa NBRC 100340 TaxID=1184609 RepID=K6VN52_9MICO|nr:putative ABC transporter substrate-binding protein [Kineosphaera limosa NBRC 100340]